MKRVIVNVDTKVIAVVTIKDSDLYKTTLTFEEIAQKYMEENHPEIKGWTEGHFCKYEEEIGECVWTMTIYTDGEVSFTEQEQD